MKTGFPGKVKEMYPWIKKKKKKLKKERKTAVLILVLVQSCSEPPKLPWKRTVLFHEGGAY